MTKDGQQEAAVLTTKRGIPVYTSNPSVPTKDEIARPRRARIGTDQKGMVIDGGSGEVLGRGGASYYEWEEVDKERFVKLFLSGIKQAAGLSTTGMMIFELVYSQVQANPDRDTIQLSYLSAQELIEGINDRTYRRGVRELLEKEFLFRSPYEGTFFVNIRYMFNGDRLAFVKAYHLKGTTPAQPELPLYDRPKLGGPAGSTSDLFGQGEEENER